MLKKTVMALPAMLVVLAGTALLAGESDYGPFKTQQTASGKVLADPSGMTIYKYDKDASGTSNCYDECAEYWPPVKASASDKPVGDLTIITRKDGSLQWADEGKPLYTFGQDKQPGDMKGDNYGGIWHVIKE